MCPLVPVPPELGCPVEGTPPMLRSAPQEMATCSQRCCSGRQWVLPPSGPVGDTSVPSGATSLQMGQFCCGFSQWDPLQGAPFLPLPCGLSRAKAPMWGTWPGLRVRGPTLRGEVAAPRVSPGSGEVRDRERQGILCKLGIAPWRNMS